MKKYGFRIGNVGMEFGTREEREKAIVTFTRSSNVEIYDSGIRYRESSVGAFSVYDRDTNEVVANCCKCKGQFGIETCPSRDYPKKESWQKEYSTETGNICDACHAKAIKDKEIFEAKKLLETDNG